MNKRSPDSSPSFSSNVYQSSYSTGELLRMHLRSRRPQSAGVVMSRESPTALNRRWRSPACARCAPGPIRGIALPKQDSNVDLTRTCGEEPVPGPSAKRPTWLITASHQWTQPMPVAGLPHEPEQSQRADEELASSSAALKSACTKLEARIDKLLPRLASPALISGATIQAACR